MIAILEELIAAVEADPKLQSFYDLEKMKAELQCLQTSTPSL